MAKSSSLENSSTSLNRIVAAAIDRRAVNIRYRQQQLHQLHGFLRTHVDTLCDLIRQDSGYSHEESEVEFSYAIQSVRTLYDQLDFDAALEQEYSISSNKDNVAARVPIGIVLIRPGTHSRLFSIVSPLAAALAAGNCVVLELPHTTRLLDSFLRSKLTVLDHDGFFISPLPITDSEFLSKCCVVDQMEEANAGKMLAIAIVDRTANVEQAVNAVCNARLRFRGESPYAPDLILINEWVREDFIARCLQRLSVEAASAASVEHSKKTITGDQRQSAEKDSVLFESKGYRLLALPSGASPAKVSDRTLNIMTTTSLVDAITIASNIAPFAACYCFGDLKTAKFLGQQVDSSCIFANGIPTTLLVGPLRPATAQSPNDPDLRYETSMMSKPRPEKIHRAGGRGTRDLEASLLSNVMRSAGGREIREELRKRALTPLKPTGQPSGTSMGFFDQGIITGLVAFVLPCVALIGYGSFKAAQFGWRYYASVSR